jgi:integrase/recombinase XerC
VRAFLADRRDQSISHASNAQGLSAIKTFYRFIIAQGHKLSWSLHVLRRPRLPRTFPRPLDAAQLNPLMCPPQQEAHWVEWRNYAVLVLLYATGLRIQEILNLNYGDWGLGESISVICKGGKSRIVPVLPVAKKAIDAYLSTVPHVNQGGTTPLFLGEKGKRLQPAIVQKHMRYVRLAHGLPEHATPHSFRHSFASHLLDSGTCLRDVQELLGHVSVRATQIYTQNTKGHLQELYRCAHPGMLDPKKSTPA